MEAIGAKREQEASAMLSDELQEGESFEWEGRNIALKWSVFSGIALNNSIAQINVEQAEYLDGIADNDEERDTAQNMADLHNLLSMGYWMMNKEDRAFFGKRIRFVELCFALGLEATTPILTAISTTFERHKATDIKKKGVTGA